MTMTMKKLVSSFKFEELERVQRFLTEVLELEFDIGIRSDEPQGFELYVDEIHVDLCRRLLQGRKDWIAVKAQTVNIDTGIKIKVPYQARRIDQLYSKEQKLNFSVLGLVVGKFHSYELKLTEYNATNSTLKLKLLATIFKNGEAAVIELSEFILRFEHLQEYEYKSLNSQEAPILNLADYEIIAENLKCRIEQLSQFKFIEEFRNEIAKIESVLQKLKCS